MRRDDNQAVLTALEAMTAQATPVPAAPSHCIEIGSTATGTTMLDIGRLLATRLLVQAGSGGGKSWLLRRILEQTHGKVRQIVFDPEGELATLSERFDFVVCAPDSEVAPISPENGANVARAIYLSGRSAIISLSEFDGLEEMQRFVAAFCRELLRMPPESWHHVLIAFDEAQLFAPQHDKAASKKALIDLSRRGRKRGMCPIFATQRVSELSKGVAGQLENKMIGLTTLDLDIARAADMLGMRAPAARQILRRLEGGQFIAFGPALGYDLAETKVGPVLTRHGLLSAYSGVAAVPSLSHDDLAAQLRGFHRRAARCGGDDEGDGSGLCEACGKQLLGEQPEPAEPEVDRRRRLSPLERLERSFAVAQEIVDGASMATVASRYGVSDRAVTTWLHEALQGVNLHRLGIRGQRLRTNALQGRVEALTVALARAKERAMRDLRRQQRLARLKD